MPDDAALKENFEADKLTQLVGGSGLPAAGARGQIAATFGPERDLQTSSFVSR